MYIVQSSGSFTQKIGKDCFKRFRVALTTTTANKASLNLKNILVELKSGSVSLFPNQRLISLLKPTSTSNGITEYVSGTNTVVVLDCELSTVVNANSLEFIFDSSNTVITKVVIDSEPLKDFGFLRPRTRVVPLSSNDELYEFPRLGLLSVKILEVSSSATRTIDAILNRFEFKSAAEGNISDSVYILQQKSVNYSTSQTVKIHVENIVEFNVMNVSKSQLFVNKDNFASGSEYYLVLQYADTTITRAKKAYKRMLKYTPSHLASQVVSSS